LRTYVPPRGVGLALLSAAVVLGIVASPTWLMILLAALAWGALSRDRRIGPLAAALAVVLALPYDRAADANLLRVASIPVRPHDVVIGLAIAVSLPSLRWIRWTLGVRLLALFGALGLAALVLGVLNDHTPRDILRDGRWWGLYAVGILAAGQGRPQRLLRGALIGLGAYSVLVVAATLLPVFPGGIKEPAIAFDAGILRMQFGNTAFLLLPIAFWTARLVRRPSLGAGAALTWFAMTLATSLTRVSMVTAMFVVIVAGIAAIVETPRPARSSRPPRLALAATALILLVGGVALGLGVNATGVRVEELRSAAAAPPTIPASPVSPAAASPPAAPASDQIAPTGGSPTPTPVPARGPLARFVPELEHFLTSIGARFETYDQVLGLIAGSPLIGHGAGALIDVNYTFGAGEFATPGKLPNVDNAYLTVGMKAGIVGIVAFLALMLWPAWRLWAIASRRVGRYLLPAWLGLLVLTMTQGFAVIGHSPFVLGLLIVAIDRFPSRPQRRTDGAARTGRGSG
jgi:O-antigen ligase